MKKSIKYMLSLLALVFVGAFAVSCGDTPEGGDNTTVTFPEKVTAEVLPGDDYTITFTAPVRWEVKVPAESAAVFRIVDGANTALSLRGSAGEQTVTIRVSNLVDFSQSYSCVVTLTMNGETKDIAELTLGSAERKAQVYVAEYSEADNYFAMDSLTFAYSPEPVTSAGLRWVSSNQYMQRLMVKTNCSWSFVGDIPAWLVLSTASGESGSTEVVVTTTPEELPLDPTEVTFSLCDYRDAENPAEISTFTIAYEGCRQMHKVEMNYLLRFNTIGDYYDPLHAMDFVASPATGTIIAPRGVKFYTIVRRDGKLYHNRYSAWITFNVGSYPAEADSKGLHHRPISITVAANPELTAREALFIALPEEVAATITDPATQLYTDNTQTEIAYDLRQYIFAELEQEPYVPPGVVDATDISAMRGYNANFEEVENADFLTGAWANVENAYRLSYKDKESGDFLTVNVPFASYAFFGYDGPTAKFENADECWLALTPKADTTNIYRVEMRPGKVVDGEVVGGVLNTMAGPNGENVGYLALYDAEGVVYAVIQCVLDPNFVAPPVFEVDTSAVAFMGEETFDATIEFLKPDDRDYDAQVAASYPGIIQVRVTHRNAMASYVGMKLPEFSDWRSTESWLKVIQNAGLPCVSMMDLTGNSGKGVITFYDENGRAVLRMVCVFGFNGR